MQHNSDEYLVWKRTHRSDYQWISYQHSEGVLKKSIQKVLRRLKRQVISSKEVKEHQEGPLGGCHGQIASEEKRFKFCNVFRSFCLDQVQVLIAPTT